MHFRTNMLFKKLLKGSVFPNVLFILMISQLHMIVLMLHFIFPVSSAELKTFNYNSTPIAIFSHVIHFHDEVSRSHPQNFTLHLNSDSAFGLYYISACSQITLCLQLSRT